MDISVTEHMLRIQAAVSAEEVIVAVTASPAASGNAWVDYAGYLNDHLHVVADGKRLSGRVVSVAEHAVSRPAYVLEYAFADRPARIHITQDLLHEIVYAPGNNWEAAYLVTVHRGAGSPAIEQLLTLTQALEFKTVAPARDQSPGPAPASDSLASTRSLAFEFFLHGVRHILTGFDHLLFIAALALAAAGLWTSSKSSQRSLWHTRSHSPSPRSTSSVCRHLSSNLQSPRAS